MSSFIYAKALRPQVHGQAFIPGTIQDEARGHMPAIQPRPRLFLHTVPWLVRKDVGYTNQLIGRSPKTNARHLAAVASAAPPPTVEGLEPTGPKAPKCVCRCANNQNWLPGTPQWRMCTSLSRFESSEDRSEKNQVPFGLSPEPLRSMEEHVA